MPADTRDNINVKLDAVLTKLNDVDKKLDVHCAQQIAVEETVRRLNEKILGNGKPGIEDRLSKLETVCRWMVGALVTVITPVLGYGGMQLAAIIFTPR